MKTNIDEASLSRVWKHFKNPDTTIVIFTAFRDEVSKEKSIQKNKKFAAVLKNNGFGYFFVDGYFPENEGTDDEVQVHEDSIFAIASKNKSNNLINLCHDLANSTNQDSIIVKELDKGIYFLDSNGTKHELTKGTVTYKEIGKYYTKLRNKKVSNTFVFEGTHFNSGFFQSFREYLKTNGGLKPLQESSLSRLWKHNIDHDCGALTAFRAQEDGEILTKQDNKLRNAALFTDLKKLKYSITKIQGTYPESGKNVSETSFFVTNINDDKDFEKNLKKLGEKYDQDSILFVPKGAIENKATAYLIGTNHSKDNWLSYGQKEEFQKGKLGVSSPIYTSKINGRPFIFETIDESPVFGSSTNAILAEKFAQNIDYSRLSNNGIIENKNVKIKKITSSDMKKYSVKLNAVMIFENDKSPDNLFLPKVGGYFIAGKKNNILVSPGKHAPKNYIFFNYKDVKIVSDILIKNGWKINLQ